MKQLTLKKESQVIYLKIGYQNSVAPYDFLLNFLPQGGSNKQCLSSKNIRMSGIFYSSHIIHLCKKNYNYDPSIGVRPY